MGDSTGSNSPQYEFDYNLALIGPLLESEADGNPENLNNYDYIESLDRTTAMIDDKCSCTCSTDTFDTDGNVNSVITVLDKKLRKLPPCMKSQAYSDILQYIRYLRRKHRKMLIRSNERNIPGC